jgi:hypothetical protein
MPNWCDGNVTIYSESREVLQALLAKASMGTHEVATDWDNEDWEYKSKAQAENVFSFENFLPTPPELLSGEGWYDWRIENWGTKWNLPQDELSLPEIQEVVDPDTSHRYKVDIGFQTAWSPAIPVFGEIAQQFDVYIEYKFIEEGMSYFGTATISKEGTDKDIREPTLDDYRIAGCVIDEAKGKVDWDNTDEYDLYLALDYWKEYENETTN